MSKIKCVKIVSIYVSNEKPSSPITNGEKPIYDQSILLKLHKHYLKYLKPSDFEEKEKYRRSTDRERNMQPERKAYRKKVTEKEMQQRQEWQGIKNQLERLTEKKVTRKEMKNQLEKHTEKQVTEKEMQQRQE